MCLSGLCRKLEAPSAPGTHCVSSEHSAMSLSCVPQSIQPGDEHQHELEGHLLKGCQQAALRIPREACGGR